MTSEEIISVLKMNGFRQQGTKWFVMRRGDIIASIGYVLGNREQASVSVWDSKKGITCFTTSDELTLTYKLKHHLC